MAYRSNRPKTGARAVSDATLLLISAAVFAGFAGCNTVEKDEAIAFCIERQDEIGARREAPNSDLYERYAAELREAGAPELRRARPVFAASPVLPDRDLGIESGIVSAAWWGFDGVDDTRVLNAAINSGASVVLVPAMESPWQTGPLEISVTTPLTLVFEPGTMVEAIEGGYEELDDWLLTIHDREDIHIVGYGAEIRMRKDDYRGPGYERSQWRHAIAITGSERVVVEGLTLTASGGDGVYLGVSRPWRRPPRDIVLRDLVLRDHHRQGITVVAAVDLLMENLTITGTWGHLPAAGIDFEPNQPTEHQRRIVMRNSCIYDNRGPAINFAFHKYKGWSFPIDIRFDTVVAVGKPTAVWSKIPGRVRGRIDASGIIATGITDWSHITEF